MRYVSQDLLKKRCVPCEGGAQPLSPSEALELLKQTPQWKIDEESKKISRTFKSKTFLDAVAFVEAVAAIAEEENHHPMIKVDFNRVTLELWTHAIGGLSENDFIVAAKVDALGE
ncbi:hypothetical protein A3D88_02530 [Candidatus Peribacteria bacterium RIFCSPHIGHO2_02_FULL_52_16]|nr:MAG: hypothetical protein A2706_00355 [Candidatus Peribacteria bacterium RIFCSPHIGHO2_01_FULL_51_35]OGJ61638.1 MAG: hypothetical protein A3D88_02530 [Candidatus Peribacteria bacterium RIFCSPHIGHO2_02_FULL_52_16]